MKKIINALSQKKEVFATDVVSVQFALLTLPYICLSASAAGPAGQESVHLQSCSCFSLSP